MLLAIVALFALSGCGVPKSVSTGTRGPSATETGPPEETYCATPISYSSPSITITGAATYQAREIFTSGSGGLGAPGSPRPIRYAEVSVKDSSGNVVQCATTTGTGTFSFAMPNNGSTYTVFINSRSNNAELIASVLTAPQENKPYKISTSFNTTGNDGDTKSVGTINATATGEILGAAFNILDQLLNANIYLRSQVANCSSTYSGCIDFTVAPKVSAYWKAGLNPGVYLNSSSVLSYYVPGYSRLFILGGVNGNVNNMDTDHFDNSVILHEYGHFLEDQIFKSNSPGGSHNGNKIIDPRLAWSEGFGNFFQAAVRNDPTYIDTAGNSSGVTRFYFYLNLETAASNNDLPAAMGEGNFREFSVTRFLWDMLDNTIAETENGALDDITGAFKDIWASLTKLTNGLNDPTLVFRNIGDFHLSQVWLQDNNGGRDLASLRTIEQHQPDKRDYAQPIAPGSCADITLTPYNSMTDNGSFSTSDLLRNNDFYHLKVNSNLSNVNFKLITDDLDDIGPKADADFYIYNRNARFGNSSDWIGYSQSDPSPTLAQLDTEEINIGILPAGDYLINVNVYTGLSSVGGVFSYKILMNGSQLCPQ